ncbi:MAG: hypothetical protein K0R17_3901 [Rariglobus sp.]|jgi:hypothetical protein|nr:hypothetical protein [Rariglobus sp.]
MPDPVLFNAGAIAGQQALLTEQWHVREPAVSDGSGFAGLVAQNHLRNFQLWHEEDVARRNDLGFERVFQAKRAIDKYNQERNNFIEEMDKALVAALQPVESGCPRNSETPGMIIDRLSILALKEFHMREEAGRPDASASHREACATKLARIVRQRTDLTQSLAELLADVAEHRRTFAVYYQFKMYNDPALNPQLYRNAAPASGA